MKVATISETKDHLSALIDRVREGETVVITDRNRPVARLAPVVSAEVADESGRLSRLERAGLVRRGTGKVVREIVSEEPPRPSRRGDVLDALLSDRRAGR